MPIFEYKCARCGQVTEFLESASTRKKHNCQNCGSGDMNKLFSSFSVGVANPGSDNKCHGCSDMGCPHAGMN